METETQHGISRLLLFVQPPACLFFAGAALLSSMYCLLAYIPSTYFAFIQAPFQSWMPLFARQQGLLFAAGFPGVALTLLAAHRKSGARRLVLEFIAFGTLASLYLIWARPLQRLGNNTVSFIWALAFLMPVIWIGAVDYQAQWRQITSNGEHPPRISWGRVVMAAAFVGILCPGAAYLRYAVSGMMPRLPQGEIAAWIWAVVTHALLFVFVFSSIDLTGELAKRSSNPRRTRFILLTWLSWLVTAFVLYKVVLASIPFQGTEAAVYAGTLALAGVVLAGGWFLRVRVLKSENRAAASTTEPDRGQRSFAALVFFLVAATVTIPALIGILDWNSVLEKSWSIFYWAMAAAVFVYRKPQPNPRLPSWAVAGLGIFSLLAYRAGFAVEGRLTSTFAPEVALSESLQTHAALDPSYEAASLVLAPSSGRYCNQQCEYVKEQTNIPASVSLNLRDVSIVPNLRPRTGQRPNIFVIVVDSLRQDYVSAYNPEVSFTPAIGAFGQEQDSVVFRNAFTRYSGTTLAEPSIWSGTLLLHKHYVQPFNLVNNLEKLITVDDYRSFISVDTVLQVLLQPRQDTIKLDTAAEKWTDIDFCSTGAELIRKIDQEDRPGKPIFFYSQPQNIHLVTLAKTLPLRPARKEYSGFSKQYASELERLDGCFGSFINALKSRRLYENSIVVLTSDHGETLAGGFEPRHGFSLRPQVMRVPLIVHLPAGMREKVYYDPKTMAFNIDITPTLYELLGQGPVTPRPEFGRPLFTSTAEEARLYRRDSYIIASSYTPLYGLLYANGKDLFIEDEGTGVEEWLTSQQISESSKSGVLRDDRKKKGEAQLRADLEGIARVFGYAYKSPTIVDWLMR